MIQLMKVTLLNLKETIAVQLLTIRCLKSKRLIIISTSNKISLIRGASTKRSLYVKTQSFWEETQVSNQKESVKQMFKFLIFRMGVAILSSLILIQMMFLES